ncbi:MAG TPA: GntR family transcriptional regulator [Steroidobacteraceae bacterium]|jgi:GntR family transcriptional regulator|nr:GntR family transcriptional regulator [Steroidobacteraceae bacterium]
MESDELVIQASAAEPIYRQIAQQLRRLIASGRLTPGDEIPSVRDVAGVHAINPMTVSRAYGQLEAEGLLERRRGKGMVVAAQRGRAPSTDRRLQQLQPQLDEIARQARELGIPAQSVLDRLRVLLEKDQ